MYPLCNFFMFIDKDYDIILLFILKGLGFYFFLGPLESQLALRRTYVLFVLILSYCIRPFKGSFCICDTPYSTYNSFLCYA